MQVLYPRCCGLDVHKRSITGCCLWFNNTQQRQEETRQFGTQTAELRRLATWLREHEVKKVVMEATGSYWRPVWNLLEMEGFEQTLANPQHMKAVPGRKTDKKDARWSADLFQHGLIAPSFVPTQQMRHLRDLTRTRTKVIQDHTRVVNRIEAVLEDTNIKSEPSQVTPVRAGQIAVIGARQQPAGCSRHRRFQRRGAEANPSLQMAGAGLQHHTRVMSVGAHDLHDHRSSTIQVDENIACVLVSGVGLDVHVASLAVANAQKPDGSRTHQITRRPKPFSGKRTTRLVVNQANQIQLVGHRRELATDGMPSQKKSTVHDRNVAIETTRRTMNSQRTANSVLTVCLTSGGRFIPYSKCCSDPQTKNLWAIVSNA